MLNQMIFLLVEHLQKLVSMKQLLSHSNIPMVELVLLHVTPGPNFIMKVSSGINGFSWSWSDEVDRQWSQIKTCLILVSICVCLIIYLAHICGDGGIIKIIDFWCPEVIEVTRYRDTGKNAKEILPVGKSCITLGSPQLEDNPRNLS